MFLVGNEAMSVLEFKEIVFEVPEEAEQEDGQAAS
jgi:hypothetical protein